MYRKQNIKRLREIGLGDREIKRMKKLWWVVDYCLPTPQFLEGLGELLRKKTEKISEDFERRTVIPGATADTIQKFYETTPYILKAFSLSCEKASEKILKEYFEEILFIKKERFDPSHFVLVSHSLYSIKPFLPYVLFGMNAFAEGFWIDNHWNMYVFMVEKHDEGVLWIEEKEEKTTSVHIFSGETLSPEEAKELIEGFMLLASRVFSSEKWKAERVILEMSERYGERIDWGKRKPQPSLLQAERIYRILSKLDINTLGHIPMDFISYITILYSLIINY